MVEQRQEQDAPCSTATLGGRAAREKPRARGDRAGAREHAIRAFALSREHRYDAFEPHAVALVGTGVNRRSMTQRVVGLFFYLRFARREGVVLRALALSQWTTRDSADLDRAGYAISRAYRCVG